MKRLLFVRHARTDLAGTFCGHSDPPLNTEGRHEAEMLLEALRGTACDLIYSSTLQRAKDTAQILAQAFAVPCLLRPNLCEIYFGDWEGLTWDEAEKLDPAYAEQWLSSFPRLPTPGGEALETFHARIDKEVEALLNLAEERNVIVVTHAGVMRHVLSRHLQVKEDEAWQRVKSYCDSFEYRALHSPPMVARP